MAIPSHASLVRLCRKRLEYFTRHSPGATLLFPSDQTVAELASLAECNFRLGRFDRLKGHRRTKWALTPGRYVDLLIMYWSAEHERVRRLAASDSAEWERLCYELTRVAARMLHRFPTHSAASDAEDFAQRACERIFDSHYPFDVPFDAWAVTILKNLIFETPRSPDILDKPHERADDTGSPPNARTGQLMVEAQLVDNAAALLYTSVENLDLLERALSQLSSRLRREVITMTYFEHLTDEQIARKLMKTKANVQTLRHRALVQLSQILSQMGVKEKRRGKRKE